MTRSLIVSLFAAALASGLACSDNGGGGTGGAGSTGSAGTTGSAGSTGTGGTTGGGGSSGSFRVVPPCDTESAYSGGDTIDFSSAATAAYNPKCLKIDAGDMVTFMGNFGTHPLSPSTKRGDLTGSPITHTSIGTSKAFTFAAPGYFAYFCDFHGPSDGAAGMVGVVWVE
jgi:plastocyanin